MNFLKGFLQVMLLAVLGFCLFGLGAIAYFHLGPFVIPQKEYNTGKLVEVISGEKLDGHLMLIRYRYESEKGQEEVTLPAYRQGSKRFYFAQTDSGIFGIVMVEEFEEDTVRISLPVEGETLKLDPETQRMATQALQICRRRFVTAGGTLPANLR